MDQYMAEIRMFAGNFAPMYWKFCQGQLLSISEYTALFSLIGTIYGGDGQVTFALPDLRSRIPVGAGSGPGLPAVSLGEMSGVENVTLLTSNLPTHTHPITISVPVTENDGSTGNGNNQVLALAPGNTYGPATGQNMAAINFTTSIAGSNSPISVVQPYLAINFIIAVEGIYPSRN